MNKKQIILHISSDFPDILQSMNKTKAVRNLIHNTKKYDHIVFSLNRTSSIKMNTVIQDGSNFALSYWGLPNGIRLKASLEKVAKAIEILIQQQNLNFDIIHAHKLTMEGIVGHHLSKYFNKPLVCSVRGETDLNVIRFKPFYKSFFAEILGHTRWLFILAPWTLEAIERQFPGKVANKSSMLPNIVHYRNQKPKRYHPFSNRFITAVRFDAKNFHSKRLDITIQAFDRACQDLGDIHLDIAGGGTSSNRDKIKSVVNSASNASKIHFIGELDNQSFCAILPDYAAFVRPSYPETFGMVYLESLFAGLPVLHAKNTGIDGYFQNAEFSVAVDHKSPTEIAKGIVTLYQDQINLKHLLRNWLEAGAFKPFLRENITKSYDEQIQMIIRNN